jgi:long-chain fatty acid transport protein
MKGLYSVLIGVLISAEVLAGGFQLNLQNNRSLGMGHTGVGFRLGAASGFYNPGALSFSGTEVIIGLNLVAANIGYREIEPGIYMASNNNGLGTPFHGYAAIRPGENSKFVFGLAAYTPFGSSVSYEDDWKLQVALREISLRSIFYQGTVSYQITDKLGIGVGYVLGTGEFALRRAMPLQGQDGNYGEANLSGGGIGHGFNIGIYYEVADNISIGASYRSGVNIALDEGMAQFDVSPALTNAFPETGFQSGLALPGVFNFGVSFKASEKLMISAEVNYVGWSSYDALSFDFEDNTEQLQDVNSPRNYKNVAILRLGAEYTLNEQLTLRGGFYYDFTPVQDGYLTPETPDMDKIGVTIGASYSINKLTIDAAFLYIHGPERRDTNFENGYSGRWSSSAFIPGISFRYEF